MIGLQHNIDETWGARGREAKARPGGHDGLAGQAMGADLAALLDDEIRAIETGSENGVNRNAAAGPLPGSTAVRTRRPAPELQNRIDVPPTANEVQGAPARSGHQSAPASGAAEPQQASTERALPVPRRIGAIIMDAARSSRAVASSVTGAGLVPSAAQARAVPDGPGGSVDVIPVPHSQRTDEQKAKTSSQIDSAWIKALHGQIDDLYRQVVTEYSSPPEQAERALGLLREARQILIETPEDYGSAEYRVSQVRALLGRMSTSRRSSTLYGPRVFIYQFAWLLWLLFGLVMALPLASAVIRMGDITGVAAASVLPFWSTMMWGGIGGVVGALYHLWWHVSDQQDFDRQYMMWYYVQPVMGLVLGGILFLALASGMLVLQVDLTGQDATPAARLLPYLLAVLGGFRQNFVYEQFDRLIALFTPAGQRNVNGKTSGK